MSPNDVLHDYFQIILKKVPKDQQGFLRNEQSKYHTTTPSIDMLTQLHEQVIKKNNILYLFKKNYNSEFNTSFVMLENKKINIRGYLKLLKTFSNIMFLTIIYSIYCISNTKINYFIINNIIQYT